MGDIPSQKPNRIDVLFVQNATSFSSGDGYFTLHDVAAATVYFVDRPRREVGHIASERFLELWDDGDESFAADPPRAVLSFLDESDGAAPVVAADVVVRLHEPRLIERRLTYRVDVLEGELPASSGACSLFIDVLGRPVSPAPGARLPRAARRRATRAIA